MPPPPKPWEGTAASSAAPAPASTSGALVSSSSPAAARPIGVRTAGGYGSGSTLGGYGGSMSGLGMGYGSMGYGGMSGMGMGYGGMSGMGMGYGGMSGMGMGYGGMSGMGMGMGMGMGGMGMPGEVIDPRGQMVFMLVGRCMEMFGMFTQVLQMVFGSVVQFMGSYIGLSQQYRQLNEGTSTERLVDDEGNAYDKDVTYVTQRGGKRRAKRRQPAAPVPSVKSLLWSLLKRLVVIAVVYFIATRTYRLCRRSSQWLVSATDPSVAAPLGPQHGGLQGAPVGMRGQSVEW